MKTRSGRTISTKPRVRQRTANRKSSSEDHPKDNLEHFYKQLNRKVIRYRDISYLSVVTRYVSNI